MEYKATSSDPANVVYIGIRVQVRQDQDKVYRVHTTVYDREEDYPYHIVRYPHWNSVAPRAQLGGVLMGRFIACQEACLLFGDFKLSVGNVLRRAISRHYPFKLVSSVWSRFLFQRWHAEDIRRKELFSWFKKAWHYLFHQGYQRSDCATPWSNLCSDQPTQDFLSIFGTDRVQSRRSPTSPANTQPPSSSPQPHPTAPEATSNDMDVDEQHQPLDDLLGNLTPEHAPNQPNSSSSSTSSSSSSSASSSSSIRTQATHLPTHQAPKHETNQQQHQEQNIVDTIARIRQASPDQPWTILNIAQQSTPKEYERAYKDLLRDFNPEQHGTWILGVNGGNSHGEYRSRCEELQQHPHPHCCPHP